VAHLREQAPVAQASTVRFDPDKSGNIGNGLLPGWTTDRRERSRRPRRVVRKHDRFVIYAAPMMYADGSGWSDQVSVKRETARPQAAWFAQHMSVGEIAAGRGYRPMPCGCDDAAGARLRRSVAVVKNRPRVSASAWR
jgi:hypothetical protein